MACSTARGAVLARGALSSSEGEQGKGSGSAKERKPLILQIGKSGRGPGMSPGGGGPPPGRPSPGKLLAGHGE